MSRMKINSPKLDRSGGFQSATAGDDGYGNLVTSGWHDEFTRPAAARFLKGGEAVMASRLEGKQPVIVTVRADSDTARITPEWRCLIDGRAYNIREFPRRSDNRLYLEFLAESGVAT